MSRCAHKFRWPECHTPDWAKNLSKHERNNALFKFIETVVNRYKDHPEVVSWQLENKTLNRSIGECKDYDRKRLRNEYNLVKSLDVPKPIIMTTSNSFGLPFLVQGQM